MIPKLRKNDIVLWLVLFGMVIPTIDFFNYEMPFIYCLTPIGMLIFICVLFGWIKIPQIMKTLIILCFMILLEIIISAFYSTIDKLGYFIFPMDMIQYVVRFIFFLSFVVFAYKGSINNDKFIKYFLIVLIIGMSIGILQWIPWPGRIFFINLYPYKDCSIQISHLNRPLYAYRMHGFAHHATANGGVASFAIIFSYSVRKFYRKYKRLTLLLIILASINIIAGQARAGTLSTLFSIILFYFIDIKYNSQVQISV